MPNNSENDQPKEWMVQYIRGVMIWGNAHVEREMLGFMALLPDDVIEDIKEDHELFGPSPRIDMVFPVRQTKRRFVPFRHPVPRELPLN